MLLTCQLVQVVQATREHVRELYYFVHYFTTILLLRVQTRLMDSQLAQRVGLIVLGCIACILSMRDLWHFVYVGVFGGEISLHRLWRVRKLHVEASIAGSVFDLTPWALLSVAGTALVALSVRRRGLVRYVLLFLLTLLLLRWVALDIASIWDASATFNHHADPDHAFEYAQHHAEAILPAPFADIVLSRIDAARQVAEAENATDHDWLHALKGVNYPIAFMPPDYTFAFPWSFVFLFLCGLGASSLTHKYSLHWGSSGRIRFVKRYPDPEETEKNDNWDSLVDNPDLDPAALSIAEQFDAKMESARLLGTGSGGLPTSMPQLQQQGQQLEQQQQHETIAVFDVPKAETPIAMFPIKDPNESQIEIGNQLRKRRDFQRAMTRNVFLLIFGILLFLDVSSIFAVYSMKQRIVSGQMKNPSVILIVDLGMVPDAIPSPTSATLSGSPTASLDDSITFANSKHPAPHQRYPQRPPPQTREWIPEYPIPATSFLLILLLVKTALPPLFAPRVRLRLYKDKLVAIPLTYPVQYKTLAFADVVAIEIRGEETPSGTLYLRHRKYVKVDSLNRQRPFKSVRGYLYSGLGDLGASSPEDHYLVMLRTKESAEDWGVQVQGMSVDRLRDILDAAILKYHNRP
ncbi:hypothetical protein BC830DRAFT_1076927 [Chytriomyces sp. MP71]|nr:hypothetical protein BC830DRAFT_1076927 [Chytriomyces sp. MP71]